MSMSRSRVSAIARISLWGLLAGCVTAPVAAQEQPLQVLFNFPQLPSGPAGTLVRGPDGSLYGVVTTDDPYPFHGASTQWGAIYALKPDGEGGYTYRELHRFNGTDGSLPAGLISGPDGYLYGTTIYGGPNQAGTIFRITLDGQFTSLYAFRGIDGSQPWGKLLVARDGNFYGTTLRGGLFDTGTIYRFTPSGTLRSLHWFGGTEGAFPAAGLVQARDGNFYGTALRGGSNLLSAGTVFRMTPTGIVTRLHAFESLNEDLGTWPAATLIEGSDGDLYGSTYRGGGTNNVGTLFKITTAGVFTQLHRFPEDRPHHLIVSLKQAPDGKLYGVASGGLNIDQFRPSGIFRYSAVSGVEWLAHFNFHIGEAPRSELLLAPDGSFFGTTEVGGKGACGTVFRFTPADGVQTLHHFPCVMSTPHAVTLGKDGFFYGVTRNFPTTYRVGSIFRLSADGTHTPLYVLDAHDGTDMSRLVQGPDGAFYGTTRLGGLYGSGIAFRVTVDGEFRQLASFGEFNGISGHPLIVGDDGHFYGRFDYSDAAGSNVFRVTAAGILTIVSGADPIYALALVQGRDGFLYGVSDSDGPNGSVFRLSKAGVKTIVHAFTASEGSAPRSLMQASDGDLYGSTTAGAAGFGTLFRMTTAGATTVLHTLTDGPVLEPLIEASDGQLYGTGQALTDGVFRLDRARAFSVVHTFAPDGSEGDGFSGVLQGPDGALYGVSRGQGRSNFASRGLFYRIPLK
jgi:uncharacterized repeat protein (TIGR03803 family)